ncbi:phospholipid scramblase family member 5-like [Ascaphus truei]|uniref:phospholipid scramblase family member 5-like n=1 Tax=Ascaphus truei TaxID=8439 RepID=UPI003F590AEA
MSVIRSQPSPFGHLRREKHIEHLSRVAKQEMKVCRCLETPHLPQAAPRDNVLESPHRTKERIEEHRQKTLCYPKGVRVMRKGCGQVTSAASPSAPASYRGPREEKLGMKKSLAAVPELEELASSELQVLAGAQQFCITSKTKAQGLSCHPERSYIISTRAAKRLLVAVEDSSCLCLHLCGPARASSLHLCDQTTEEVLRFCRPYRVDVCCLCCCLMVITVFSASSNLIGSVQQRWSLFSPSLVVCDSEGTEIMEISGSWSASRCHTDQEFQVTSRDGRLLAVIWKRWPGFHGDYNMDHDFFGLDISAALSPAEKALLLAATFLLNYMFFEMS